MARSTNIKRAINLFLFYFNVEIRTFDQLLQAQAIVCNGNDEL